MSLKPPSLEILFVQLGLPGDEFSVRRFIRQHRPLAQEVDVLSAPFWSPAQAAVLWKLRRRSPHWCTVLAQLEAALREPSSPAQESA